jgi:hypothetical protein
VSDDPINALVAELLAEADHLALDGTIRLALDAGLSLVHNPSGGVVTDESQRIRPGYTVVRLHGLPVGIVDPWGWRLTIDEDRVRYALLRTLARLRDGFPLASA